MVDQPPGMDSNRLCRRLPHRLWCATGLLVAICLGGTVGCLGNHPTGAPDASGRGAPLDPNTDRCAETAFASEVWSPILASRCFGCHIQNGFAQQVGARFTLADTDQPNYVSQNLAKVRAMAAEQVNNMPLILAKASQQVPHQGGQVLDPNEDAYAALKAFLSRTDWLDGCAPRMQPSVSQALITLSPQQLVQRAALQLAGRLPNNAELQQATQGNVNAALDSVLADPNFASFVKRTYEDIFLLDGFNNANVIGFLYDVFYGDGSWYDEALGNAVVEDYGFAHNATELVAYIVTQDRPYTEVLNANYMLVNAQGACNLMGRGHNVPFKTTCTVDGVANNTCTTASFAFTAIDECYEYQPIVPVRNHFPVIGILSDGALFTVYQSTPSNKNRHRAAMVLKTFLGLDVLRLGPRVAPNTAAPAASDKPTMTVAQCQVCHRILDGVASSFQNWDRFMQMGELEGIYGVGTGLYDDQFTPRLNGALMPNGTTEPLKWLADSLIADPRFAHAAVTLWYTALTGRAPLPDPPVDAPNYLDALAVKLAQNDFFATLADDFVRRHYSVKSLIKAILQSPWYTAVGVQTNVTADVAVQATLFDHTTRREPEALNSLLAATTGQLWRTPSGITTMPRTPQQWQLIQYLLNDFRVSYGGIDSRNTIVRNADMSSVAAAVATFMAQDAPCQSVATDFARAAGTRALFPYVDVSTTPDTPAGIAAIRRNVVYLHQRLLNETIADTDPEVDATLAVFNAVYHNHAGDTTLDPRCQSGGVTQDAYHTVHAWMAVLTYLLSDFDFLYQ